MARKPRSAKTSLQYRTPFSDVVVNKRSAVSLPGNPLPIRQERSIAGKAAMKATSSSVRKPSLGLAQLQKWAAILNAMSLTRSLKRSS